MTPQDFILNSIRSYPSLYQRPTQVIENALCCIGTGIEWKGGELMYIGNKEEKVITIPEAFKKQCDDFLESIDFSIRLEEVAGDLSLSMKFLLRDIGNHDLRLKTIVNAEEISKLPLSPKDVEFIYPLSSHSPICNIPNDVTLEWKQVIKDFYFNVLIPRYSEQPEEGKKWVWKIRPLINSF